MRDKNRLLWLVFFIFLFAFPTALVAQEELTQTYTSPDGLFSMNYPEGWTVNDENDDLVGFNGDGALFQVSLYDYGVEVTALEILEVGVGEDEEMRTALGYSEPEQLLIAGFQAVQSRSETMGQLNTIIDFGGGIKGNLIGFGDVATFEPTFMAMMQSIQYGDGPPPIDENFVSLMNMEPITSANAAQVAQLIAFGDETVPVESVAFDPDGQLLAAAGQDGDVHLWSMITNTDQGVMEGNPGGATSIDFGSGGYSLVVGTGNGSVVLWDVANVEVMGFLQRHDTAVESVAFTELFLVASGSLDGAVRLWDISMGSEVETLEDSDNTTPVEAVAFSPDDTLLAAGGGNIIRVWDAAAGTLQATLETEIDEIGALAFSPDGSMLAYSSVDSIWVWDLADDNHALVAGNAGPIFALTFSPDGTIVASGEISGVSLWDAVTGENLVKLPSEIVSTVAFSPDGSILASGGVFGGAVLWGTAEAGGASTSETTTSETTTTETESEETTTSASSCSINAPSDANLRSGPGTEFERAGGLTAGQSIEIDGQATGADGLVWYRLTDGAWARIDVIGSPDECTGVPVVTP